MTEFANDFFSVAYPPSWTALESEDGSGLTLASSPPALDRIRRGRVLASGDCVVTVSLTPSALFQSMMMPLKAGATAAQLAQTVLARLRELQGTEASAAEVLSLADGRQVAVRSATAPGAEGAVLLFEIAEGIIAIGRVLNAPGEYAEAEPTVRALLASLRILATPEALSAAINAPPPFAPSGHSKAGVAPGKKP